MTEEEKARLDTVDTYRELEWRFSMWEDVNTWGVRVFVAG
jgi:hypothetical protein